MKIVSIYISFLQMNRAFQIMGILIKHSFGELFAHTRFGKRRRKVHKIVHTTPERIRMTIEDLGPTFVKFGQIWPTARIWFRRNSGSNSKTAVPRRPVRQRIRHRADRKELNAPLEQVFSEFDRPLAAASIGQVYQGRLVVRRRGGRQNPTSLRREQDQTGHLPAEIPVQTLREASPELAAMNITGLIDEFSATILKELDYTIEASNINRFRIMFKDNPSVHIPVVHTQHCTKKAARDGEDPRHSARRPRGVAGGGLDLSQIARNGADALLTMILKHGFFHADPHPGNIFVMEGNVIGFIDFGMVGALTPMTSTSWPISPSASSRATATRFRMRWSRCAVRNSSNTAKN